MTSGSWQLDRIIKYPMLVANLSASPNCRVYPDLQGILLNVRNVYSDLEQVWLAVCASVAGLA